MDRKSSPLAYRTIKCLDLCNEITILENAETSHQIVDTISRFRLWAGNLGTSHPSSDLRSADYRLRDAPMIVTHISELLDEFSETLKDIIDIITGQRIDQSKLQPVITDNGSLEESEHSGEVRQSDERESTSELQELLSTLPDLLTSLFKVSILIRKNTSRDRYAKAASANYDSFLPDFDVAHVVEKFPKVRGQQWLYHRLGNAITKRRQYLRYIRDHRDNLAKRPVPTTTIQPNNQTTTSYTATQHPSEAKNSSHPTVAQTTASTLQASNIQMQQISQETPHDLDDDFEDTKSHATSFATSRASDDHSGKLRVTRLEDMQKYGPEFECSYCGGIVKARKQRSWKRHVLRDLRAYVCTFKECSAGLFEDKLDWFKHELEHHRRQWFCPNCPGRLFNSATDLQRHLISKHMNPTLPEIVESAVRANSRPVAEIAASSCPLCNTWDEALRDEAAQKAMSIPADNEIMMPLQQFRNHLAGHLEQLALFAIPPIVHREVDSEAGSHHDHDRDRNRVEEYVDQTGEYISEEESNGSQSGAPGAAAEPSVATAVAAENGGPNFYSSWKSRNKILSTLLPLQSLPETSGDEHTVRFKLEIPREISEELRSPGRYSWKIFLGCANRHYQVMVGVEFPKVFELNVNGHTVLHDFQGAEEGTKISKPVDLTPYVRLDRPENDVWLRYATDWTSFHLAIYLVEDRTVVMEPTNVQASTSQFQHQSTPQAGLDPELVAQITQQVTEKVMSGLKGGIGTTDEVLDTQPSSSGVSPFGGASRANAGDATVYSNNPTLEFHPQLAFTIKDEVMDQLKQRMGQIGTDDGITSAADSIIISETIKRAMRAEADKIASRRADQEQGQRVLQDVGKREVQEVEGDLEAGEDSEDEYSDDDSYDRSVPVPGHDLPDAVRSRCMFCGQVEEHDPDKDFEEYLVCSVCGRNAHRRCALDTASLNTPQLHILAKEYTWQWRCDDCVAKGLEGNFEKYWYPDMLNWGLELSQLDGQAKQKGLGDSSVHAHKNEIMDNLSGGKQAKGSGDRPGSRHSDSSGSLGSIHATEDAAVDPSEEHLASRPRSQEAISQASSSQRSIHERPELVDQYFNMKGEEAIHLERLQELEL